MHHYSGKLPNYSCALRLLNLPIRFVTRGRLQVHDYPVLHDVCLLSDDDLNLITPISQTKLMHAILVYVLCTLLFDVAVLCIRETLYWSTRDMILQTSLCKLKC